MFVYFPIVSNGQTGVNPLNLHYDDDSEAGKLNGRILAVDDNEFILHTMKNILSREGLQVDTTTSGRTALELIRSEEPSLVLLDILLADISGFELLQEIRRFSNVPVIMLSGLAESAPSAERSGAVQFIPKPFDPQVLIEKVKLALNPARPFFPAP